MSTDRKLKRKVKIRLIFTDMEDIAMNNTQKSLYENFKKVEREYLEARKRFEEDFVSEDDVKVGERVFITDIGEYDGVYGNVTRIKSGFYPDGAFYCAYYCDYVSPYTGKKENCYFMRDRIQKAVVLK